MVRILFLCMCWRRMFCSSYHSSWETNLKSIPFKVLLSWKQCSSWRNYRKGLLVGHFQYSDIYNSNTFSFTNPVPNGHLNNTDMHFTVSTLASNCILYIECLCTFVFIFVFDITVFTVYPAGWCWSCSQSSYRGV